MKLSCVVIKRKMVNVELGYAKSNFIKKLVFWSARTYQKECNLWEISLQCLEKIKTLLVKIPPNAVLLVMQFYRAKHLF